MFQSVFKPVAIYCSSEWQRCMLAVRWVYNLHVFWYSRLYYYYYYYY